MARAKAKPKLVFGPYPARPVQVIDGDTVVFDIDLGFDHLISGLDLDEKVRLSCRVYGINAPERNTAKGKRAKTFTQELMDANPRVQILSHGWDKYGGRFDGDVILADGTSLAQQLLENGHAVAVNW